MKTIVLSIAFIIVYGAGLYLWLKKTNARLSESSTRYIKYLHYFLFALFVFSLFMHFWFKLDLRGIWTTRIIIFGLLTTGIFFYPFARKKKMRVPEKAYFLTFSCLPIGIAGVMLVPILGSIIVFSLWAQLTNPISKIHYEDSNLRIQSSFSGLLGPSQLDIIEKKGLFEKSHYQSITHDKHFDSLKVSYDADATRIIIKSTNKFVDPEQVITIETEK